MPIANDSENEEGQEDDYRNPVRPIPTHPCSLLGRISLHSVSRVQGFTLSSARIVRAIRRTPRGDFEVQPYITAGGTGDRFAAVERSVRWRTGLWRESIASR